jgi:hypothetical protein
LSCSQDLYAGGQLEVFGRAFELLDADEYTYKYMENNKHIFIMADADAIIKSLRVQVSHRVAQGGGAHTALLLLHPCERKCAWPAAHT